MRQHRRRALRARWLTPGAPVPIGEGSRSATNAKWTCSLLGLSLGTGFLLHDGRGEHGGDIGDGTEQLGTRALAGPRRGQEGRGGGPGHNDGGCRMTEDSGVNDGRPLGRSLVRSLDVGSLRPGARWHARGSGGRGHACVPTGVNASSATGCGVMALAAGVTDVRSLGVGSLLGMGSLGLNRAWACPRVERLGACLPVDRFRPGSSCAPRHLGGQRQ